MADVSLRFITSGTSRMLGDGTAYVAFKAVSEDAFRSWPTSLVTGWRRLPFPTEQIVNCLTFDTRPMNLGDYRLSLPR